MDDMGRRRRWWLGLAIVAIAVVAIATAWWLRDGGAAPERPPGGAPPVVVSAAPVERQNWHQRLEAIGTLSATRGVDVTTEVGGLVSAIHFQSGDHVRKGDVLVELSTEADRARLASLNAQSEQARSDLERRQQLAAQGVIAKAALEEAETEARSLEAQVEEQRELIARKRIRAPFTGALGIRLVNLGQFLSPGTAIVTLQSITPIELNFSLSEEHYADVAAGQPIEVQVDAFPQRIFRGTVSAVSPRVDANTRNFAVQGRLENDEELLRPGMFAEVNLRLPESRDVLAVPVTAISYSPYGDSVYLVRPPEQGGEQDTSAGDQPTLPSVHRVFVKVGERRGPLVAISGDVGAGAQVVSAGQMKLFEGARVVISPADGEPRTASAPGSPQT